MKKTEMKKDSSPARYLPAVARVLMGLVFLVFGLNGFLNFIPIPADMPEKAMAFFIALSSISYMLPLIGLTEVVVGVLLLSNRFVPLALALIAPVVVNIMAFHIFVDANGIVIALLVLIFEVYLAWVYRAAFRPMLAMNTKPG